MKKLKRKFDDTYCDICRQIKPHYAVNALTTKNKTATYNVCGHCVEKAKRRLISDLKHFGDPVIKITIKPLIGLITTELR